MKKQLTSAIKEKTVLFILLQILAVNGILSTTFYIDPTNGSNNGDGSYANPWRTLEEVVNQNLIESFKYTTPYNPTNSQLIAKNIGAPIKAGDTLALLSGLHGQLFLQNYINSDFITITAVDGQLPIIKNIHLQACKNWRFENIAVSSEPYGVYISGRLIYLESHNWQGPTSNIDVINCEIYSTAAPWTVASDWTNKASQGIYIKGDSVNIFNNKISNISFGVQMVGDYIYTMGNIVQNFSGDGMRILGSHILMEKNLIKNCYDVDDNHDDGIQSFTTNGYIVDNNIVRGNIILNYEDPNQPLLGPLQGMGFFDGFFNNWIIENNIVAVNHWHGITFLGANNCKIYNNTVLDPTPNITPGGSWIKIDDHKNGTPSSGCEVKNNVANSFDVDGATGNNKVLNNYAGYADNFVDYINYDFHLLPTSTLIDAADDTVAPAVDFDGVVRPQGAHSDIGAFEFQPPTAVDFNSEINNIEIFPNPFSDRIIINGELSDAAIFLFNETGNMIHHFWNTSTPFNLNTADLSTGIYFIYIFNEGEFQGAQKIIKQ
ncbi:MAG: choice-of-anchor Q domain-containing protein [Saprospiraceae bacterium]